MFLKRTDLLKMLRKWIGDSIQNWFVRTTLWLAKTVATLGLSPHDLHSNQLLAWVSRASCSTKPARLRSSPFPRRCSLHSEFVFDSFCCLLSLGIDAVFRHSGFEAEGTIKVPERKEGRMLEIRLALVPVKFQGFFVNSPAGYWS